MSPMAVVVVVRYMMRGMPGCGVTNTSGLDKYSLVLSNASRES